MNAEINGGLVEKRYNHPEFGRLRTVESGNDLHLQICGEIVSLRGSTEENQRNIRSILEEAKEVE